MNNQISLKSVEIKGNAQQPIVFGDIHLNIY